MAGQLKIAITLAFVMGRVYAQCPAGWKFYDETDHGAADHIHDEAERYCEDSACTAEPKVVTTTTTSTFCEATTTTTTEWSGRRRWGNKDTLKFLQTTEDVKRCCVPDESICLGSYMGGGVFFDKKTEGEGEGEGIDCGKDMFTDYDKRNVVPGGVDTASQTAACCTASKSCSEHTCPAGFQRRKGTNYCETEFCESPRDDGKCCEADKTKCANVGPGICNATFPIKDKAKNDVVCTANNNGGYDCSAKLCCSEPAKCSTHTCPTSAERDATLDNHFCRGSTCESGYMFEGATKCAYGWSADDMECCTKAKCSTHTCPTGMEVPEYRKDWNCTTDTCGGNSEVYKNADDSICCTAIATKCKSQSPSVCGPSSHGLFFDLTKANNDKGDNATLNCCTAKATCATHTCTARAALTKIVRENASSPIDNEDDPYSVPGNTGSIWQGATKKTKHSPIATYCGNSTCVAGTWDEDETDIKRKYTVSADDVRCCKFDITMCGGRAHHDLDCGNDMVFDDDKAFELAGDTTAERRKNCCKHRQKCSDWAKATKKVAIASSAKSDMAVSGFLLALSGLATA